MPKYSKASKLILSQLHPDLQLLLNEVIKIVDVKLICGHRDKEQQNHVFKSGWSKLKWPKSKHNKKPSLAVDFELYPFSTNPLDCAYVAGIIYGIAAKLKIKIRCGADWNKNHRLSDETFKDLCHVELAF